MLKHIFSLVLIVFIFSSCDDTNKRVMPKGKSPIIAEKEFPKEKEMIIDIPPPPAPYTGPKKLCFEMELGDNSNEMTRMQFILDDNDSILGRLDYSFADRLPVHGTIEGIKEGDRITLNYLYADSGTHKVEQLILKMEDDKLYKKTGPLVEENGILVLENPKNLTFQLFLIKAECK